MKAFKISVSAFLMVSFPTTLTGCDRLGSHGKEAGHGHNHDQ